MTCWYAYTYRQITAIIADNLLYRQMCVVSTDIVAYWQIICKCRYICIVCICRYTNSIGRTQLLLVGQFFFHLENLGKRHSYGENVSVSYKINYVYGVWGGKLTYYRHVRQHSVAGSKSLRHPQ